MVYVWEFEFFESGKSVLAWPFGDLGEGTFGEDFEDAVEGAADWLGCLVEEHLMGYRSLPPMEFGHEPEHGGKVIAVAVSRELTDIPAVTAAEAARMLGVSTARIAQLVKARRLDSWKVGGTRMVSLASVNARMGDKTPSGDKEPVFA